MNLRPGGWLHHSSVPYERDPLSVRYDAAAGKLLGQAIAAPGRWVSTVVARPTPGPRTIAWLRAHGITLDRLDSGGLTAYERAYQRSLYWTLNGGGNGRRNPSWSLQREWGPVTARGRVLAIRVSDPKSARLAVNRKPKRDQWWRNPELRSGGEGSTQQRFG